MKDNLQQQIKERVEKRATGLLQKLENNLLFDIEPGSPEYYWTVKYLNQIFNNHSIEFKKRHHQTLKYEPKNHYPRAWMLKDKQIRENLYFIKNGVEMQRYPLLWPLLNYIHNSNKGRVHYKQIKKLPEDRKRYTTNGYLKTQFVTDKVFYKKTSTALNCNEWTLKKYLYACHKAGFFERWPLDYNQWIYSDGYYLVHQDKFDSTTEHYRKKILYLTKDSGLQALQKFKL